MVYESLQCGLNTCALPHLLEISEPDAAQARQERRRGDHPQRMRGDDQAPPANEEKETKLSESSSELRRE